MATTFSNRLASQFPSGRYLPPNLNPGETFEAVTMGRDYRRVLNRQGFIENKKVHPRLRPTPTARWPVSKGWMEYTPPKDRASGPDYRRAPSETPRAKFHFVFNPSDLSFGYGSIDTVTPDAPDQELNALLTSDPRSTLSFKLMVDRHYEVQGSRRDRGVLEDLYVLEYMTGVSAYDAGVTTAVIASRPIRFFFGGKAGFSFTGQIRQMSVDVTHFSHDMRPTRAVVSIMSARLGTTENDRVAVSPSSLASNFPSGRYTPPGVTSGSTGRVTSQTGSAGGFYNGGRVTFTPSTGPIAPGAYFDGRGARSYR